LSKPAPSRWIKVLDSRDLEEGRVKGVTCRHRNVCLTRQDGRVAALDNACPHQGGPLSEGSIENGWLRCPWHGWDFHPTTGKPPGGYDDGVATYPVEERPDGIYVAVPPEEGHAATVSDVMVETMVSWGVRAVFGMVGHSNLGLADAVRRQAEAGGLRYVGIRHEGAASFACSAYGKLTGRPAACLAIAGPGATNLLTGLWDAHVDRAPVLALTGQVDTQVLGPGAFQEIDLVGAFGKVAVWSQTVLPSSRHAELVNLALKTAILERGVSHLIFPDEVQTRPAAASARAGGPEGRLPDREIPPPAGALDRAVELLQGADRPALILGHGARFHSEAALALAEALDAPVLTTFKGKGVIPDDHPLAAGVLGRSGTPVASWFMNEADALLVLGASFSNHTGITPRKPIIQVDRDPMILGKFHAVEVPVWGEIGVTLGLLAERLAGRVPEGSAAGQVAERQRLWRQEKARRRQDDRGRGLASAAIFHALQEAVPADAILPVDVGNNTYSFGRYFECRRQAVLMSGYLGSIGFALPAALGAWMAASEPGSPFAGRKVVSISGDGGFGQYLAEWTTAVKYGMDITHILLRNEELGKISKEQRAGRWDVWETGLSNPSFADFSTSCGGLGLRVARADELGPALERGLAHDGPALVEIVADPELV
jgi:thiamine pyrophosphate-dependent acetolactate synthase large subunit-like protein/nitrite reductase/ring-hydroxylating ferredoxin subunit